MKSTLFWYFIILCALPTPWAGFNRRHLVAQVIKSSPASHVIQSSPVRTLAEWRNLEFTFDSPEQEAYAIEQGYYSPEGQKRLYELDIHFATNGEWREFVSIPRISGNLPFTVATVDRSRRTRNGPYLRAYPNIDWHLNRTCDGIIGVFRLTVHNECNQLWIIDSGRDITLGLNSQLCPPKIMVFDLTTDRLIYSYEIPIEQFYLEKSAFNSITLLPNRTCSKQIAYITDARGTGMIVFDLWEMQSWRTFSGRYDVNPDYQKATIAGETFNLPDGIYGVAPNIKNGLMYFHAFASLDEIAIPLRIIHNRNLWISNANTEPFFKVIGQRPTQSTSEAFDSNGNLWFTLLDPLALVCWNPKNPYTFDNFKKVLVDETRLQFVSGLKIQNHPIRGEILIVTSNRNQKHYTGTVNPNEINYRAFFIAIKDIDCTNHID